MKLFFLSSIIALGLAACGNSADTGPLRFADGFLVQSILTVDESPAAINVLPVVRPDPFGGYLVADISEAQIRRYGDDGDLRAIFGRRGDGPGEFQNPGIAVRIPSGQIVVLDRNRRITVLDSSATEVASVKSLPLQQVNDADVLNDTLLLVSAAREGARLGEQLHLVDLQSGQIARSFFVPPVPLGAEPALNMTIWSVAAIRGDTIAAAFSTSDTVYILDPEGVVHEKIPMPSQYFRPIKPLPADFFTSANAQQSWIESFDVVKGLEWTEAGDFIVQFMRTENGALQHSLLKMSRQGRLAIEIADTPRLLSVISETGSIIVVDPSSEVPNRWLIGTLESQ